MTIALSIPVNAATCLVPLSFPQGSGNASEDTDSRIERLTDGHTLILYNSGSLYDLPPQTGQLRASHDALGPGKVWAIRALPDGTALVASDNGLYLYKPSERRGQRLSTTQSIGAVTIFFTLKSGDVLVGTTLGLFKLGRGATQVAPFPDKSGASLGKVLALRERDDGSVIISTSNGVLIKSVGDEAGRRLTSKTSDINEEGEGWYTWTVTDPAGDIGYALAPATQKAIPLNLSPKTSVDGSVTLSPNQNRLQVPYLFYPVSANRAFAGLFGIYEIIAGAERPNLVSSDEMFENAEAYVRMPNGFVVLAGGKVFAVWPDTHSLSRVSQDGYFVEAASSYVDGRIVLLDNAPGVARRPLSLFDFHTGKITFLKEDQQDNFATLNGGGILDFSSAGVYFLNPKSTTLKTLISYSKYVYRVQTAKELPDGRVILFGNDKVAPDEALKVFNPRNEHMDDIEHSNMGAIESRRVLVNESGAFASTDTGLYLLPAGGVRFEPIGDRERAGTVDFQQTRADVPPVGLIRGSHRDLLTVLRDDTRKWEVEISDADFPIDVPVVLTAQVTHGACTNEIGQWHPVLRVRRPNSGDAVGELLQPREVAGNVSKFEYTFKKRGAYDLHFELSGLPTQESAGWPEQRRKAGTLWDAVIWWARHGGVALLVIHTVFVIGLAIAARWSVASFKMLTDPVWGRVGVWFNFLFRHCPAVQVWLLNRYVSDARAKACRIAEPYEPLPLSARDGGVQLADEGVFDVLKKYRHVWLHGDAGMGKSAIVRALEQTYFCCERRGRFDAAAARNRWGAIFVFIPARRHESVASDPNAPEQWLIGVTAQCLSFNGLTFPISSVRAMLNAGTLALVVDGVNEVGKDEQVAAFALLFPATMVLATSQTEAREPLVTYRLPKDIHGYVGRFLGAYLGESIGDRVEQCLQRELPVLVENLRSGYDVRLVVDLLRQSPTLLNPLTAGADMDRAVLAAVTTLPSSRIGLYQAILAQAGEHYPVYDLARLAWNMMLEQKRILPVDPGINERLIEPLERENVKIVRRLSSMTLEFRHDQMRAYLAAFWLVKQAANAETLTVHLKEPEVWRMDGRDQDQLWPLVAAMMPSVLIPQIWKFAMTVSERYRLQHAMQDEARLREIALFEEAVVPHDLP
ncbi:hypothetical protein ACW9YQ_17750 (plasmid) [Paraburkholderia strydomiana]